MTTTATLPESSEAEITTTALELNVLEMTGRSSQVAKRNLPVGLLDRSSNFLCRGGIAALGPCELRLGQPQAGP